MEDRDNNSTGTWLVIVIAALLFYVLSPGPIILYYKTTKCTPPQWPEYYLYPLGKLYEHSKTVHSFYDNYFKLLGVHP